MSGGHFHVHGPHDHAVEHAAQGHGDGHGDDGFASRIAVTTAVLSTIGALFGYEAGHTQNAALLYKNEAAIQKTSESDQWNYYQAKGNKRNLAEFAATLSKSEADQERYKAEVERYKKDQAEIKAKAEELEAKAKEADKLSAEEMHIHGRWALGTTLLQIAIALSAIALLTRKKWLLWGVYGASAIGVVFGVMGAMHM